ncbi:MAG: hypothetical protein IJ841_03825 [Prevotella sp.]|nr:hypothetical protein [Prevotella sp.]
MRRSVLYLLLLCACLVSVGASAAKVKKVSGKYTYVVTDNENITLRDAKEKCIELAKADALKREFGELVVSDAIDVSVEASDRKADSYFWENTTTQAKGLWLGNTREPKIEVSYADGKLIFTAEVWGEAREIKTSNTDVKWKVMRKTGDGKKIESTNFDSRDRLYVNFQTAKDGYVAIYLVESKEVTLCLLPYSNDEDGMQTVRREREYTFFDKEVDGKANYINLTTKYEQEDNVLVMIYSPNPFTKSIDQPAVGKTPNKLSTADFYQWLQKCYRNDPELMVERQRVTILGKAK